jgi:hypothetical protein
MQANPRTLLVMGVNDLPAYEKLHQDVYRQVNQASQKFQFEIQTFPNKRAFIAANDGHVDGVAVMPKPEDEGEFKNLIRIEPPLYEARAIIAIPRDAPDIVEEKQLPLLKVAMINGAIHAMNRISPVKRIFVHSHLSGLMMVAHKRIPAMLTLDIPYHIAFRESPDVAQHTRLAALSFKVPFYLYVHKKHGKRVNELESLLKQIAASGATQKVYDKVVEDLARKKP